MLRILFPTTTDTEMPRRKLSPKFWKASMNFKRTLTSSGLLESLETVLTILAKFLLFDKNKD